MRRTLTNLMMLMALFLMGSQVLSAQTEVWNQTYAWNINQYYRGIAYNNLNNHLYVAGGDGTSVSATFTPEDNHLYIIDAATGDVIKSITPAAALEPGAWGYGIRDVEVDDAGGIYAITGTSNAFHPVHIVYWENEDAEPVQIWREDPSSGKYFGGALSVSGSFEDEALILVPIGKENLVYYWEVEGGNMGEMQTLALNGVASGTNTPNITALGTKITDGFWYNHYAQLSPVKIDGNGDVIATIPAELFTTVTTGDTKQFTAGSDEYVVVSDSGDVQVFKITGKAADLSDLTAADLIYTIDGTVPVNEGTGWPSVYGDGQEQVALGNPDGSWVVYTFSSANYFKAVATDAAPTANQLKIDGVTMVDEVIAADYLYVDFNGDAEGATEFQWYAADNAAGDNKTAIAGATASSLSVTAGLDGKYLSVEVLPVAATGTASSDLHKVETALMGPVVPAGSEAPVASDLSIVGPIAVNEVLTGSYTYTDANGDLEGASIYKWYTADDAAGTNKTAIEGANENTYTVLPADDGKFIIFEVTPVTETGALFTGETMDVTSDSAVYFPEIAPFAIDLSISGREEVAGILTGSYTYLDLNGDAEGATVVKWYRADDAEGTTNKTEVAADVLTYSIVAADEGKYIIFEVTPVTEGGETGNANSTVTAMIAAEPAPEAPVASEVEVHGNPEVGVVLSASYTYSDRTDDPEGASIYKWYTCDDANGSNPVEIAGAGDLTLLVTEAELGKHLIFEVSPVAQIGGLLQGDPVQSAATATATAASTQDFGLERIWKASVINDASPWYLNHTVTTERGMAVGTDHIYIASRNRVMIVDKTDGSYVGELDMTGIEGGIFALNDVEVSEDGQILGVPLVDGTDFWVYKWSDELSAPVKWLNVTPSETASGRYGDKFTVTGDLSGDAVIYAARNEGNVLLRWRVSGGIAGDVEEVVLAEVTSLGTAPAVAPFSVDANANLLIDGKGMAPVVFDKDGNILGSVPMIDNYAAYKIQSNSPNVFEFKGRYMAAFFQAMRQAPLGARIIVADVTSAPYQVIDSTEYVSNQQAWDGYLGEVDVTADANNYYAYMLQAKHALAAFKGDLEFPKFSSAISNFEGDKVFAFFDKALAEMEKTEADSWTIMSGDTELGIDSMYVTDNGLVFELTAAITEGAAVTVTYDGTGTTSSFNGLPVVAFGPEAVENIVGAEVPVAADVTITGTPVVAQELTGSYIFADPDGDAEGTSLYQWYEATGSDGSGALKLLGETSLTYTPAAGMAGKYVAFEVTPVAAAGGADYLVGNAAMSGWVLIGDVAVEDMETGRVKAYPNPFNHMISLENLDNYSSLAVCDITGKVVKQVEIRGQSRMVLNMEELAQGIYFVKLNGAEGHGEVLRVVKAQ